MKVPYHYLYTVILVICYIGGYGISNTMFNIYVMLAWCVLAIFMSIAGLPTSPLVLAFILSSKLERYFRQGISYAHGSYKEFFYASDILRFTDHFSGLFSMATDIRCIKIKEESNRNYGKYHTGK